MRFGTLGMDEEPVADYLGQLNTGTGIALHVEVAGNVGGKGGCKCSKETEIYLTEIPWR